MEYEELTRAFGRGKDEITRCRCIEPVVRAEERVPRKAKVHHVDRNSVDQPPDIGQNGQRKTENGKRKTPITQSSGAEITPQTSPPKRQILPVDHNADLSADFRATNADLCWAPSASHTTSRSLVAQVRKVRKDRSKNAL